MTYTGYTFKGWYDNEGLTGSPVTAIGDTETGNKEYWAKWEANTYTVTFYPNGGRVNPVTATTDSSGKLSSLPTPTRGGNYRFDGWYTEQTGGIKVTLNQVYTADTTLYAYWIYTSGTVHLPKTGTIPLATPLSLIVRTRITRPHQLQQNQIL